MAAPMKEYVYDPTRRFHRIYDHDLGLVLMISGSVLTIVMTIVTLGMILDDQNYAVGITTGLITLFGIFIASPMLHCSGDRVREKRAVYKEYLGMNKKDRRTYRSDIRLIHKDGRWTESLDYNDMINLFKSKSLGNPDSINSRRASLKQELKDLKAIQELNIKDLKEMQELKITVQNEIDKINKTFDL